MIRIKLKRVYELPEPDDGLRVLVDKMWPRGLRKADLPYDIWAKDITPSPETRRLFHENPEQNWTEFRERYTSELRHNELFERFVRQLEEKGTDCVTLLYAFRNPLRNHALILRDEIQRAIRRP